MGGGVYNILTELQDIVSVAFEIDNAITGLQSPNPHNAKLLAKWVFWRSPELGSNQRLFKSLKNDTVAMASLRNRWNLLKEDKSLLPQLGIIRGLNVVFNQHTVTLSFADQQWEIHRPVIKRC